MSVPSTISPAYLALQQELHKNPNYGTASIGYAPLVKDLLDAAKAKSLSDYGAGKKNLFGALQRLGKTDYEYLPYDPAFPEYGPPQPADLVCCIDVLEHIEPDYLPAVLTDLRTITRRLGLYSVATGPAQKFLVDGRNAHLIQQPTSWWLPKLCEHFEIHQLQRTAEGFWVVVYPKAA